MRLGIVVGLAVMWSGVAHTAPDITRPRITSSVVEWAAAIEALSQIEELRPPAGRGKPDALVRLNAATAKILPNIAASPVPVLLPIDLAGLLSDHTAMQEEGYAAKIDGYFAGFHYPRFFQAGLAGYDTTFTIHVADIKELLDISVPDPIDIHFSGLAFYYELDNSVPEMRPVPALEAKFPGIRRFIHEGFVRYAFTQYGVPYVLAIDCFDGRPRVLRLLCSQADRIAVHFLSQLQIAGGTPQQPRSVEPPLVVRSHNIIPSFTYYGPGRIYPGSGFRDAGGRVDYTVYAPIRFPLADTPAFANSQIYRDRPRLRAVREAAASPDFNYPWRDNFCERRGFTVGQCPNGIGHQGQDIRPAHCTQALGNDRCDPPHSVIAVRDGAIMRSPKQEAVYLVVNNANEHVRFRYLHMEPRKLDEENILSGRDVREGEVIGQVSTYSQKENGTSYHLHFDMQVPTRYGWSFVNPYMTLVVSYERMIGGRGVELYDSPQPATAAESDTPPGPQPAAAPSSETDAKIHGVKDTAKDQAGVNEPQPALHE